MAVSVARSTGVPGPLMSLGGLRAVVVDITYDSSYPTGGETLTAADVGLGEILFAQMTPAIKSDTTAAVLPYYHVATGKIITYWGNAGSASILPETTDTTSLSGYISYGCVFWGH